MMVLNNLKRTKKVNYYNANINPKQFVKEGTILITRRTEGINLFRDKFLRLVHMGITAVENGELVVYDLHPENQNNSSGNLDKKSVDEYMRGKKLVGIYHTNASSDRIRDVAGQCWRGKYEKYYFNCQKFIDEITMKQFSSDLYSYYSGIILGTAGVAFLAGVLYMAFKPTK